MRASRWCAALSFCNMRPAEVSSAQADEHTRPALDVPRPTTAPEPQAGEQPEAVPQQPVQKDATPQTNPAAELDYWSPEPVKDARHSPDFRSVYWFGQEYSFTANQAACVRLLWEAWENGTPELSGAKILEEADIDQDRLSAVFRDHPAWKTMIRPGHTKGAYRLSPPTAHRKAPKNHG